MIDGIIEMADLSNKAIIQDKQKFIKDLSKERDKLIDLLDETLKKEELSENSFSKEQLQRNILLVIARGVDQYFWFCYWLEDKIGYYAFDQEDFEALGKSDKNTSDGDVSNIIKIPYDKCLYSEKVQFEWIIGTTYTRAAVKNGIVPRLLELSSSSDPKSGLQPLLQDYNSLLEKYDAYSPDKLKQMTELELIDEFIIPLFQLLGWLWERPITFHKPDSEPYLTLLSPSEDIKIPVEVKRFGQGLDTAIEQAIFYADPTKGQWAIVTNFEIIQILDIQAEQIISTWQDPNRFLTASDLQALTPEAIRSGSLEDLTERRQAEPASHSVSAFVKGKASLDEEPEVTQAEEEPLTVATRALSDAALTDETDYLGFNDYAEAIADFIKNDQTKKPITIGIDAPWGMGKTTLMHKIRNRLSGQEKKKSFWYRIIAPFRRAFDLAKGKRPTETKLPTVWFNAWKYDEEEKLWAALALEILKEAKKGQWGRRFAFWWRLTMKRFESDRALGSALKSLWRLISPLVIGIIVIVLAVLWVSSGIFPDALALLSDYWVSVGTLGTIAFIVAIGKQLLNIWNDPFDIKIGEYINAPNYESRVGFLSEFEEDFARVVDIITDKGTRPLVIFIDDLDRCAPPKPVEIIEAINILLDSEHCVFVIGMDTRAIIASIETKYGDLRQYIEDDQSNLPILGKSFLEKIIQIQFRIPPPSKNMISEFIARSLDQKKSVEEVSYPDNEIEEIERIFETEQRAGKSLEEARQGVKKVKPEVSPDVIEKAQQEVFARSFDDSAEVTQTIEDVTPYLGANPRKIKRFINAFRLQALIANRRGLLEDKTIDISYLGKWTIIALRWPEFIGDLSQDPKLLVNLTIYGLANDPELAKMHSLTESSISLAQSYGSMPLIEKWSKFDELMSILTTNGSFQNVRCVDYLHLSSIVEVPE